MIRVDAHQHFWKLSRDDYEWLTPDLVSIYRDFMPDDLAPHLNRSGVDRDWPVLHLAYEAGGGAAAIPYASWCDAATILVARLSSHERELIFGGTAARFYGIA